MTHTAYIGLGSNLDNPIQQVQTALTALNHLPQTTLQQHSSLYQSKPLGPQNQPNYINAVALLNTTLPPLILLKQLQAIENTQGRIRGNERWGARTLDLDILLYDNHISYDPILTLPHTGLYERAFVLYPLYECVPDLVLPNGERLEKWVQYCPINDLERIK